MQPVLQGYLGLLQGEKICIIISLKTIEKLQWPFLWRHGYKTKMHKRFNFIISLTFSHLKLNIILKKKVDFRDFLSNACIKQK